MTLENLINIFNKVENEEKLFGKTTGSLNHWIIIRTNVFVKIQNQLFNLNKWKNSYRKKQSLFNVYSSLRYLLRILLNLEKTDYLVIPHGRREKANCNYIGVLQEKFQNDKKSFQIINISENYTFSDEIHLRRFEVLISIIGKLISPFYRNPIKQDIQKIYERCGVTLERSDIRLYKVLIIKSLLREKIYHLILKRLKPKALFLVDYYNHFNLVMCQVAKDMGVLVTEFQHGPITKYSIQYCFPESIISPKGFPDNFLFFGDNWKGKSYFPIPKENQFSIGFKHLEKQKQSISKKQFEEESITLISQPSIAPIIQDFAKELSMKLPVKIRLHPSELRNKEKIKANLVDFQNISIDENINPYDTVIQSRAIIGVHSTLLFEALYFGKKVYILEGEFSKVATDYDKNNEFEVIKNVKDFLERIDNLSNIGSETLFFKKFNESHFNESIKFILSSNY